MYFFIYFSLQAMTVGFIYFVMQITNMEAPMATFIYKITCSKNSRIFVGQSINPKKRYKQHKSRRPSCMKMVVQKYKTFEDYFKMEILYKSKIKKDCNAFELDTI